jgi:hypothetical protein
MKTLIYFTENLEYHLVFNNSHNLLQNTVLNTLT